MEAICRVGQLIARVSPVDLTSEGSTGRLIPRAPSHTNAADDLVRGVCVPTLTVWLKAWAGV